MKFYIANLFSELEETKLKAEDIKEQLGWNCTASWIYGGEKGLRRREIAEKDLEDVYHSDCLIAISYPRGLPKPGGGRWVEFGYALGLGKKCFVIGNYENVFCHTPGVKVYPSLQDFVSDQEKAS